jgi:CheY-like chemotaxis protein
MMRTPATPPPPSAVRPVTRRSRLLVVDDDPMIRRFVRRVLTTDHDVSDVAEGADALAFLARGESFDLVLCDVMMPHMSGIELYRHLQLAFPLMAEKVVFITASARAPSVQEFLRTAPVTTLEKPFGARDLRDMVEGRLALQREIIARGA